MSEQTVCKKTGNKRRFSPASRVFPSEKKDDLAPPPSHNDLHGDTMSSEAETKPEAEAKSVEDAKTSEDVDKAAEALGNVGVAGESPIPPIPHFFPRIVANARLPAPPPPSPSLLTAPH